MYYIILITKRQMPLLWSEGQYTVSPGGTGEWNPLRTRFHGERTKLPERSILPYDVCLFGNKYRR